MCFAEPWARIGHLRMKYVVWSMLVWVPAVLIAVVALATIECSNPNGCFGPDGGDIAVVVVFVLALPIYLIGLLAMLLWDRSGRPPRPR
jgi:hypothetical protein